MASHSSPARHKIAKQKMEKINVIAIVDNVRIMDYISLEGIFIGLYFFAMVVLIIRIEKGIKQRKLIEVQDKTIKEQKKLINLLKK